MTINPIETNQLNTSMTRISAGQRVNPASDDPAGLAENEQLTPHISGLDRFTSNDMDMQQIINAAEGGLNNISENLHRIRELTVQSQNNVLNDSDRQNIQHEIDQLIGEIDATTQRTEFNTMRLLDGSFSAEDGRNLHTAADAMGRGPMISIGNMSASMLLGPSPFNVVAPIGEQSASLPPAGSALLQRVDDALTQVSGERAYLEAMNHRFDTTIASNQITNLNVAATQSGIRDTDIELEVMRVTQQNILEQAQLAAQHDSQAQADAQLASLLV